MRSPLSGPIATLLMFVPLVAIPLLAVFGMPQLSSFSPAVQVDDLKFAPEKDKPSPKASQQESELIGGVQVTDSSSAAPAPPSNEDKAPRARSDSDPFADFIRPTDGDSRRPAQGDSRHAEALSGNRTDSPERGPEREPIEEATKPPQKPLLASGEAGADDGRTARPDRESAAAEPATMNTEERTRSKAGTRLTAGFDANRQRADADRAALDPAKIPSVEARGLKAAVARLNALGIRDYQLQPGEREGEFHFSCRFISPSNPRIMQRFEAEAGEPLEAIEQVLQQIDEWKGRRRSAGVRTSSREAQSKVTALAAPDETAPLSAIDVSNR